MPFFGETIAIVTVLCWTISVQCFGTASKEVGATAVNIVRITVALLIFSVFLTIRDGSPIPTHFPPEAWNYLLLSGVVGFFIGDYCLFKALVMMGPRIAMLLQSLSAPAAAIIGWMFLSENYNLQQWAGILVTLAGVAIVILERQPAQSPATVKGNQVTAKALMFSLGGLLGQAGGFVLSKAGMQTADGYLDAFSATQIRAIAAFFCFILLFTVRGKWRGFGSVLKNRRVMAIIIGGTFVGPFLGVSLSLLTLHYLSTGVASTLLSLVPVTIIPFAIFLHKEKVSLRAICGAFVAVAGVGLLMW
ncbi:DMT family transporter [Desulfosediminicola sp.]|uniref:DMT family transporter n=1 Tax=Desulfosediminicola sp. TaxID=2886825 RepID=UPI003AF2C5A7